MTPVQRLRGVASMIDATRPDLNLVSDELRDIASELDREDRDADFWRQVRRAAVVCVVMVPVLYFLVTRCLP